MAKSKKSKILAMALCASVMTGIYAAPVMADNVNASFDSSSGNIVFKIAGDTYTINKDDITKAIERNRIHSNGSVTANAGFIARSGYYAIVGDTQYAMLANKEYFALGDDLRMNAQDNEKRASFYVDNATGNVTTKGDVTTLNDDGTVNYSLNTIGANTAGIVRSGETTTIEKTVSVDKWGLKVLDENGKTVASINSTNGGINAANDKFHVWSDGAIEGTALSLKNNGAQNVYIGNSGTARFGAEDGNNVRIENGVLYVNRNNEQLAALGENGLTLTSSNDIRATLDAEQIANLNSTIKEGGVVDAKELNVTGDTGGLYVKDVTNENGITGTMIYTKAADGKTNTMWIDPNTGNLSTVGTIGVGFANGLNNQPTTILDKTGDINVGISYNADGSVAGQKINLDAETGNITLADKATVDGVDVSELSKNVGDISADLGDNGRLGGITRTDENNDDIFDTTTIEGSTSFDANGMNVGNGAVVANADGSFSAGNGAFGVSEDGAVRVQSSDLLINNGSKDESIAMTDGGLSLITTGDNGTGMVTLSNGTVSLMGGSTSTVTINGDGTTFGTLLGNETTNINGGTVTASNDFVTTNEDGTTKYTLNTVGNNLKDLSDDFKTTNANVAGIERTYNELYDTYTTHIEGALHISENAISTNGDIFNFSYDLGNGYTGFRNLGKLAIDVDNLLSDVSDLTGRVETVEGKTEHISVDESGNTTISSPNGDTTLTVSDDGITMNGDTVMNGDSTTGNQGGSGDGSVTNPDSDHIVNGGQTVNNGQTVNGGQVVNGGQTINGGQTVNGDAQFNDQVTVGDTDDNQTVINGGNVTVDNSVTVGGSEGTSITGGGVTVGGSEGTTVGKDGVTVGGENGTSIKNDSITVGDGGYIGDGDVVSGEGVSLNQTAERVGHLENRVGELEDRIDKVGAMAAAIANLRTMGYDPAAPTEVAVGIGQYRDETGAALGLFHYPNRDFMLSLSVSTSGDEVMGGIGATWKFGRKSPEKVAEIKKAQAEADARRAEEAKLAKAEEMKQAAKEAKIKAQQERHAKLAAERAAQAEAAK